MSGTSKQEDDNVSVLTTGSQMSIWSQAAMILRGENPNAIMESEDAEEEFDESSRAATKPEQSLTDILRERDESDDKIDFLKDDPKEMTYGRRIALSLMDKKWYYPQPADDDDDEEEVDEEDSTEQHSNYVGQYLEKKKATGQECTREPEAGEKRKEAHWTDVCHPVLRRALLKKMGLSEADIQQPAQQEVTQNSARVLAYPFTHTIREVPSLAKAWAYFDHVSLSRYVDDGKKVSCMTNPQLNRAEPGERGMKTSLYSPLLTPHSQLGDFGLGVGLYFATLRAITVLCLLAGILNIPNFIYFSGSEYAVQDLSGLSFRLKGSAICDDTEWVPCPTCEGKTGFSTREDLETFGIADREAIVTDGAANYTFYLRNNCEQVGEQAAYINYATLMLVLLGVVALNIYLHHMEVAFDEDEQTAQDYSILISNPPGDATDPAEWHNWVKTSFPGSHATVVTVAVDNDLLVRSLVERREILKKIELLLEPGTSLDNVTLAGLAAAEERNRRFWGTVMAMISPKLPELFARLTVLTAKVQGLAQQDYPAKHVFLTLETEEAQRKILTALNVGSTDISKQRTDKVKKDHLFRQEYLLDVSEPDEPNTVRWQDLNEKWHDRLKQQGLTTFCTMVAIGVIALIIFFLNDGGKSPQISAYGIAIANSVFPEFAKILTSFEAHSSEGGKQRSLYFKIALFRWVNTAVVFTIITPFNSTLTRLIPQIEVLFFAEIVTTSLVQLLDPAGHFERHFLAPRAVSQDAMNLKMQGSCVELAERYTNMTKILFLALWYCSIYPGALLLCALALFINYYTDRFSLMRTWKRPPMLGKHISEFSRRYFISLAVVAMSVMASYFWSGFPFDSLCPSKAEDRLEGLFTVLEGSRPLDEYLNKDDGIGLGAIFSGNGTSNILSSLIDTLGNLTGSTSGSKQATFDDSQELIENPVLYEFCKQDFIRYPSDVWTFPFIPQFQIVGEEWMSESQERVTTLFGWTSVSVLGLVLLSFWYTLYKSCLTRFHGTYESTGDDQGVAFSDLDSKTTYIPEVESQFFSYPLLAAANLDTIDEDLFEWTDPDRIHAFYDLTKDIEVLLQGTDLSSKVVFSQVAHFAPEKE